MFRPAAWLLCVSLAGAVLASEPAPLVRVGKPDIEDIAYSPDGRALAVATMRAIELLDSESGAALDRLEPGGRRVMYSHDGAMLAAIDGPARFWNARTGAPLGSTAVDVDPATFIPGTGLFAYGKGDGSNTVFLWTYGARASRRTWNPTQRGPMRGRAGDVRLPGRRSGISNLWP